VGYLGQGSNLPAAVGIFTFLFIFHGPGAGPWGRDSHGGRLGGEEEMRREPPGGSVAAVESHARRKWPLVACSVFVLGSEAVPGHGGTRVPHKRAAPAYGAKNHRLRAVEAQDLGVRAWSSCARRAVARLEVEAAGRAGHACAAM